MSENEKKQLVGQLVMQLVECVRELNRMRCQGHKMTGHLRVLADCLDSNVSGMRMHEIRDGGKSFTVQETKEHKENRAYQLPKSNTAIVQQDGAKKQPFSIPDGKELQDIAKNIEELRLQAEELLSQLKNEGVDVRYICSTLSA